MAQIDNSETIQPKTSRPKWLRAILWVAFLIAALLMAYLTYIAVRDFTAAWEMTSLPGITVKDATPTPGGDPAGVGVDSPLQPVGGPTPPPWDGADRVSLLVMGLDYRDWVAGEGPPRTDTMILLTIDPISRTAGMISIPRDLWVNIPGYEYGRINTAYQLGEAFNHPGGGPALATETVEALLGVPIDYYAQVDFGAFRAVAFSLGQGRNLQYLKKLNEENGFFDRVAALPHPRWVMQYRYKKRDEFLQIYTDRLNSLQFSHP